MVLDARCTNDSDPSTSSFIKYTGCFRSFIKSSRGTELDVMCSVPLDVVKETLSRKRLIVGSDSLKRARAVEESFVDRLYRSALVNADVFALFLEP
jgi:hypothetical protein